MKTHIMPKNFSCKPIVEHRDPKTVANKRVSESTALLTSTVFLGWCSDNCIFPVLRIRDVYPGSRILIFNPFRIPDPKTATTERGGKKYDGIPFYVATKLYFILVLKS